MGLTSLPKIHLAYPLFSAGRHIIQPHFIPFKATVIALSPVTHPKIKVGCLDRTFRRISYYVHMNSFRHATGHIENNLRFRLVCAQGRIQPHYVCASLLHGRRQFQINPMIQLVVEFRICIHHLRLAIDCQRLPARSLIIRIVRRNNRPRRCMRSQLHVQFSAIGFQRVIAFRPSMSATGAGAFTVIAIKDFTVFKEQHQIVFIHHFHLHQFGGIYSGNSQQYKPKCTKNKSPFHIFTNKKFYMTA